MIKRIKEILIIIFTVIIFSCDMGTSYVENDIETIILGDQVIIEQSILSVIYDFQSTLNDKDYLSLQVYFHPDMAVYDSYMDADIFDPDYSEDILRTGPLSSLFSSFEFDTSSINASETTLGDYDFRGTFNSSNFYYYGFKGVMRKDGDNWKILTLTVRIAEDFIL